MSWQSAAEPWLRREGRAWWSPRASSSTQSGVQVTFGSTQPAGTTVQLADADGTAGGHVRDGQVSGVAGLLLRGHQAGEEYTVYTGGTAQVSAGLGEGSLDGATKLGTVTAGEYTQGRGPGGR